MKDSKTLICSTKFPKARERISSKLIDNLGTCPQKGLPAKSRQSLNLKVVGLFVLIALRAIPAVPGGPSMLDWSNDRHQM